MTENNGDSFTSTKAEVFEALGHPTRIRILQELASKPLAYSELKRAAGMESNGLLTFHLGRLKDLVGLNAEGNYALTDEGREALRIVEASKSEVKRQEVVSQHFSIRTRHPTPVLVFLIVALVALASVSMVEYTQVQALDSNLNNTPPIPSPCTMQVALGGVETPVLLMQPGTTGYICITYQSERQGNSGQYQSGLFSNGIFPFGFSILNATCVNNANANGCRSSTLSNSFAFSASPSSIRPTSTTDYIVVVYSVTALGNSTGFYDYGTYGFCGGMPMAVGYTASQVNSPDFVPGTMPQGCFLLAFHDVAVSVGPGMNVAYVALS